MSSATLQDAYSVEALFNVVETETLALFEHLSFEFLEEFDVFAPSPPGRTRDHDPSEMMRGFLHCYYKDIYGIRPVERELQNMFVWVPSAGCDGSDFTTTTIDRIKRLMDELPPKRRSSRQHR